MAEVAVMGMEKLKIAEEEVARLESSLSARAPELEKMLDKARAAAAAADAENKLLKAELSRIKAAQDDAEKEQEAEAEAQTEAAVEKSGGHGNGDIEFSCVTPMTPEPETCTLPRTISATLEKNVGNCADTPASRSGSAIGSNAGSVLSPSIEDAFNDQSIIQMTLLMQEKSDLSRKNAALVRENRVLEERLHLVEMEMVDAMQRCAAAESSVERMEQADSVRVVELELEMARIKVELAESVYERERAEHEARRAVKAREREKKEEWEKVSAEDV